MPDMPGMVRRLGRESTARRLGFARLGRLESWMLESGMHNSDRHHSKLRNPTRAQLVDALVAVEA